MTDGHTDDTPLPPEGLRSPWSRSTRPVARRVVQPLQAFLEAETSSAILLLLAALAALVWANAFGDSYARVWGTEMSVGFGRWTVSNDLRGWVSEGLMTLFFLVVGLEIKRELTTGELRDRRAAAVPVIAAVGGMIVPALIYLALNAGGPGERGWGIPMATDIAFALGVLTLAARGVPAGTKAFLLTLAIVDDIGATIVIGLFYSRDIDVTALIVAALLLLVIFAMQRLEVRSALVYVGLGVATWLATLESGINPTIAGVALGLLTPAVAFQRPRAVSEEAKRIADETVDDPRPPDADAHLWLRLASLSRETVSPLARVEAALHPVTSAVVVPLFALANAGVVLSTDLVRRAAESPVAIGIVAGLVLGKFAGIVLTTLGTTRLGTGRLPDGMSARDLAVVASVAGIGFTVSLFMTELAFADGPLEEIAKVGIFAASILAGLLGLVVQRFGRSQT